MKIQIFAREGDIGWFDAYCNGEWIDAYPSYQQAVLASNQWKLAAKSRGDV